MDSIKRKSLLYETSVEYSDFCLNHIQGCSHGCTFPCYAFNMAKRYGRVKSYDEWKKPKIVENALQILDKEIPRLKKKMKSVHLCFTTDPFMMGYPEVSDLSLKIIQKLNQEDIKCTTLTKGIYPEELTDRDRFSQQNEHGITLVSLDEEFRQKWEPFASEYPDRISGLKRLHNAGLKTWVSIEPYPTPNIINQDLEKILQEISFVDKIIFGRLNYNSLVKEFKEADKFYKKCSDEVEDFCVASNKKFHDREKAKKENSAS
jgi:DNA repair photolyase